MNALPLGNYLIRPFKTYKSQSFSYSYLGASNPQSVTIDEGVVPPANWTITSSAFPTNPDGITKWQLYASVKQLFYLSASNAVYIPSLGWDLLNFPTSSIYVVSVSTTSYGEQIRPGSFQIIGGVSTGSIVDDGQGRLFWNGDFTTPIGNIFYPLGIAILQEQTTPIGSPFSNKGVYFYSGSQVNISYNAQWTIYEHTILCSLEPGEFNWTTNPTMWMNPSSSITGSGALGDFMLSGSLTPYITTLALANDNGEIVAVGKVPRPIKRSPNIEQTFVVRFDI
jgi:hypothetical protein